MATQRERMEFDVLIIGAGPAGLSAAIRLGQLNQSTDKPLSIAVLEKGAAVGSHLLSGAVLEPRALDELLPNWKELNPPTHTAVSQDAFYLLGKQRALKLPHLASQNNSGNSIVSLGELAKWLAEQAEQLGASIFAGFSASELLFNEDSTAIEGVTTGDMGLDASGQPSANFQPGIDIIAKQTIFSEGCRGHLSQQLMQHFKLREHCDPQTYAIGIKEIWQISDEQFKSGLAIHSAGWPLDSNTYGGGFMYHFGERMVSLGVVIGLDYRNPTLDPFEELQQLKRHPLFKQYLSGGKCISYGARALNEGGWQSIPQCHFPGGLLAGCSAGFMNVAKIKGNHTAMKSGMLAAESIFNALQHNDAPGINIIAYQGALKNSWINDELHQARNIRPAFAKGKWAGMLYTAVDQWLLRGRAPWTFRNHVDHLSLKRTKRIKPKKYPKPDNQLTFSKLTQLHLSGTNHRDDQPCHLKLHDDNVEKNVNIAQYGSPESHYCPAGVYEIVDDEHGKKRLQINFQNCLHCKTCDIKDPTQNIKWTPPEGGEGPNYTAM